MATKVKKVEAGDPKKALPFKRANAFLAYPEDLYLEKSPGQKHYDPRVHRKFVERDVVWIMIHGVQDPVLVDKLGNKIAVISGRGRVINTLEANRRLVAAGKERIQIPVVLKRGDPAALFEISVIVNTHRQDDDPVTEAFKFAQYMGFGRNEEDCAKLWGKDNSKQTVKRKLKLLELCPEVQKAVVEETVSYLKAIRWCDLSFEDQRAQLAKKPAPAGPKRPSAKRVETALTASTKLPAAVRAAIEWATGRITDQEAAAKIKGLELEAKQEAEDPAQTKFDFMEPAQLAKSAAS